MEQRRWPEHLDSVVEEFDDCFDSMERYELLFEYSKRHPSPLPPEEWNDENQVHGCQSRAHVECSRDDSGKFIFCGGGYFEIFHGFMSVKALAVNVLLPDDVANLSPDYADAMGIRNSLTPSRANGFLNMFERVRSEAEKMV